MSGTYQFTTIDYSHPVPTLRSSSHVSVLLQTDGDAIVAGADIEVLSP